MTRWQRFLLQVRLGSLRGRDHTLHKQIAGGYAQGRYHADARREQQQVRAEIRRIEKQLGETP